MTGFSPAARHFFAQAAWFAFAPFTVHLESLTQPLTVSPLALSAADATTMKQNTTASASNTSNAFFIAIILLLIRGLTPRVAGIHGYPCNSSHPEGIAIKGPPLYSALPRHCNTNQ